jgi:uncharacterized membrane protein HdeD (DUF308 family)
MPQSSSNLFVGRWWVVFLRGLAALAFGGLAFAWPHLTLLTLVRLFGGFALAYGVFSTYAAVANRRPGRNRWLLLLEAAVAFAAGIVSLRAASNTVTVLIFLIGPWALVTGILRVAEAIRLRNQITGDLWLGLSGAVTIILAMILFRRNIASLIELAPIVAGYALLLGLFEILLGFDLRKMRGFRPAA